MSHTPTDPPPDPAADPHEDEAHRKFREALERKKLGHHATAESAAKTGVGPSSNTKTTRQFRRKSGG
jgi:hypothetical protein